MLLKGSPVIDWLIGELKWWVSERASEWVSEWGRGRGRGRGRQRTHRRTTSHHSWYLPKWLISFVLFLSTCATRVRVCPALSVLDHPWRVFFRVRPGPCPWRIHAFSDITWSVVYHAKTEIRLAGSVLMERFATINLLISIEKMAYGYQANMVCNTNNIC